MRQNSCAIDFFKCNEYDAVRNNERLLLRDFDNTVFAKAPFWLSPKPLAITQ